MTDDDMYEVIRKFGYTTSDQTFELVEALRAALAQPEQQWQNTADKCKLEAVPANGTLLPKQEPAAWEIYSVPPPLYPAPPQREWQGLTDEEIEAEYLKGLYEDYIRKADVQQLARAIETKLKEKNT